MGAAEKRASDEVDIASEIREFRSQVDRLETVVNKVCVMFERWLAANDQGTQRFREHLAKLHPDMARIQQEVVSKRKAMRK